MAEQMWEYCALSLDGFQDVRHNPNLIGYDCNLGYFGSDGSFTRKVLSTLDAPVDYDPFRKAFGLLGGAGWELVSVQHTTGQTFSVINGQRVEGTSIYPEACAYFKRPVVEGRKVSEPEITMGA